MKQTLYFLTILCACLTASSCTDFNEEFGFEGSANMSFVEVTLIDNDTYSAVYNVQVSLQNIAQQTITAVGIKGYSNVGTIIDTKANISDIDAKGTTVLRVTLDDLRNSVEYRLTPYIKTDVMTYEGNEQSLAINKDYFLKLTLQPAELLSYNSVKLTVLPNDWQYVQGVFTMDVSTDNSFNNFTTYNMVGESCTINGLIASTTYYYRAHYVGNFKSLDNNMEYYTPAMSFQTGSVDVQAVDLGLSVKWATKNLIDEINHQEYFKWYTGLSRPEYKPNSIAGTKYDVTTQLWGQGWQMPTAEQMRELVDLCTWTPQDGLKGWTIIGPNGNNIFMPAAGYRYSSHSNPDEKGKYGYYWISRASHYLYADFLEINTTDNQPIMDHPLNADGTGKRKQMDVDRLLSIRPVMVN